MELYRRFDDGQERYFYFMLAAAGAAIALSVQQTLNARLHLRHPVLGARLLVGRPAFLQEFATEQLEVEYPGRTIGPDSECTRGGFSVRCAVLAGAGNDATMATTTRKRVSLPKVRRRQAELEPGYLSTDGFKNEQSYLA